jgi:hypothetical protein
MVPTSNNLTLQINLLVRRFASSLTKETLGNASTNTTKNIQLFSQRNFSTHILNNRNNYYFKNKINFNSHRQFSTQNKDPKKSYSKVEPIQSKEQQSVPQNVKNDQKTKDLGQKSEQKIPEQKIEQKIPEQPKSAAAATSTTKIAPPTTTTAPSQPIQQRPPPESIKIEKLDEKLDEKIAQNSPLQNTPQKPFKKTPFVPKIRTIFGLGFTFFTMMLLTDDFNLKTIERLQEPSFLLSQCHKALKRGIHIAKASYTKLFGPLSAIPERPSATQSLALPSTTIASVQSDDGNQNGSENKEKEVSFSEKIGPIWGKVKYYGEIGYAHSMNALNMVMIKIQEYREEQELKKSKELEKVALEEAEKNEKNRLALETRRENERQRHEQLQREREERQRQIQLEDEELNRLQQTYPQIQIEEQIDKTEEQIEIQQEDVIDSPKQQLHNDIIIESIVEPVEAIINDIVEEVQIVVPQIEDKIEDKIDHFVHPTQDELLLREEKELEEKMAAAGASAQYQLDIEDEYNRLIKQQEDEKKHREELFMLEEEKLTQLETAETNEQNSEHNLNENNFGIFENSEIPTLDQNEQIDVIITDVVTPDEEFIIIDTIAVDDNDQINVIESVIDVTDEMEGKKLIEQITDQIIDSVETIENIEAIDNLDNLENLEILQNTEQILQNTEQILQNTEQLTQPPPTPDFIEEFLPYPELPESNPSLTSSRMLDTIYDNDKIMKENFIPNIHAETDSKNTPLLSNQPQIQDPTLLINDTIYSDPLPTAEEIKHAKELEDEKIRLESVYQRNTTDKPVSINGVIIDIEPERRDWLPPEALKVPEFKLPVDLEAELHRLTSLLTSFDARNEWQNSRDVAMKQSGVVLNQAEIEMKKLADKLNDKLTNYQLSREDLIFDLHQKIVNYDSNTEKIVILLEQNDAQFFTECREVVVEYTQSALNAAIASSRIAGEKQAIEYAERLEREVQRVNDTLTQSLRLEAENQMMTLKAELENMYNLDLFQLTMQHAKDVDELQDKYLGVIDTINNKVETLADAITAQLRHQEQLEQVQTITVALVEAERLLSRGESLQPPIDTLKKIAKYDPTLDNIISTIPNDVIQDGVAPIYHIQKNFEKIESDAHRYAFLPPKAEILAHVAAAMFWAFTVESHELVAVPEVTETDHKNYPTSISNEVVNESFIKFLEFDQARLRRAGYYFDRGNLSNALEELTVLKNPHVRAKVQPIVVKVRDRLALDQTLQVLKAHSAALRMDIQRSQGDDL